jgi:hypothetical protein
MRYVGPGDLTDGSVCDIVVDCVGANRTDAGQINFIKTLTIVRFDRAPPTSRTSYAAEIAAAAEEDPSRASAVDVLNHFKAQRAAAAAAAATKKVIITLPSPLAPVPEVSEAAGDEEDSEDAELAAMAAKAEKELKQQTAGKRARASAEAPPPPSQSQSQPKAASTKKPRKQQPPPPPPSPVYSAEESDAEAPLAASQ